MGSEVDINALRRLWTWDIVAFEEESSKIKLMGLKRQGILGD